MVSSLFKISDSLKASQEAFSFEKNGIQTKKSSNVSDYMKNNKKYTKFVKKLLTSVLDVVNITELLGKPQDTQLGNI